MNYATLYQVKEYIQGIPQTDTTQDGKLLEFLSWSSNQIRLYKERSYEPVIETRKYDLPGLHRGIVLGNFEPGYNVGGSQAVLRLDEGLLACDELLNGDGSEVTASEYVLEPANLWPKTRVKLRQASGTVWGPDADGNVEQVIELTGTWGNHDAYNRAWVDSLDTVRNNPLTINGTSLTVTDADGQAGDLAAMRFQAGQLIRMESELALVLSVTTTTNVLEIVRAANGSTAAAHAQGTKIEIFRPQATISLACLRLTKWRYAQKDVDDFDKVYALGMGTVNIPARLPADVVQILGMPGKARL
jgi:hypothetical protein